VVLEIYWIFGALVRNDKDNTFPTYMWEKVEKDSF